MIDTTPGTWSTDEYIRAWARRRGLDAQQDCVVPLQSVQQHWVARIRFDVPGNPVERFIRNDTSVSAEQGAEETRSACTCGD